MDSSASVHHHITEYYEHGNKLGSCRRLKRLTNWVTVSFSIKTPFHGVSQLVIQAVVRKKSNQTSKWFQHDRNVNKTQPLTD